MLKPVRMKLVRLLVMREDAPQLALTLAETAAFEPEASADVEGSLPEPVGERFADTFGAARAHLDRLLEFWRGDIRKPRREAPVQVAREHVRSIVLQDRDLCRPGFA